MLSSSLIYYSLQEVINIDLPNANNPFIIANEMIKKNGDLGRYYTLFGSFEDFLKDRNNFIHSHEILTDHKNKKIDKSGRLVFDFDIKLSSITSEFKNQVEDIIILVVENYFHDIDTSRFNFIWSSSPNPKKISKHLTVKNLCFSNWIKLSKIFYQLFCIEWDGKYSWIKADKLVDLQIIRKNASLRMVGSCKIGGSTLVLDNEKHQFVDSLIRNYQKVDEQIVTKKFINEGVLENVLLSKEENKEYNTNKVVNIHPKIDSFAYPIEVYKKAFDIYNTKHPGYFKMGKICDRYITLLRVKKGPCLLSNKIHENENAYLDINNEIYIYTIYFKCFRKCSSKSSKLLGFLTIPNLLFIDNGNIHPEYKNNDLI